MRRAAAPVLCLACFAAVAAALSHLTYSGLEVSAGAKGSYFTQHKDDYDLIFVGSSHFLMGIIPRHFDAEMAARGVSVRSFNFGLPAMRSHETSYVLRKVLGLRPRRLRYVVVEMDLFSPLIHPRHEFNRRVIAWHDLPTTLSVLQSALLADQPAPQTARQLWLHARHFAARGTAVGQGPRLLRALAGPVPSRAREVADLDRWQGYRPAEERLRQGRDDPERERYLAQRQAFERQLRRVADARAKARDDGGVLASYNLRALIAQRRSILRAGAVPLYVAHPSALVRSELAEIARRQLVAAFFFDDPGLYPELYAPPGRWDRQHLSEEGARRFTSLLAERLAAYLRRPQPS
jgi:hypothetical protein